MKIVLREGLGSTVKSWHDKNIADQARNDAMGYKASQYQVLGVMPEGKSE